jgi:hypothetical protein
MCEMTWLCKRSITEFRGFSGRETVLWHAEGAYTNPFKNQGDRFAEHFWSTGLIICLSGRSLQAIFLPGRHSARACKGREGRSRSVRWLAPF